MKTRNSLLKRIGQIFVLALFVVATLFCQVACDEDEELGEVHTHVADEDATGITTDPTCVGRGYTTYECEICGENFGKDYVAAKGHTYDDDGNCTVCGKVMFTRVDADGNESVDGEYVVFGSYPQSEVTDATLTAALTTEAGTLPTADNAGAWTSYGFYQDGKVVEYAWYRDVVYQGETYRAVYFTEYRPATTGAIGDISKGDEIATDDESYQDENGYHPNQVYWFKHEPIVWRVLSEVSGETTLIADQVLDYVQYETQTDGVKINYADSDIRAWLNDTFYKNAFDELEAAEILKTTVENGPVSTGWSENPYSCDNTEDSVYLLSYNEARNLFESAEEAKRTPTDYAKCLGGYTSDAGTARWWLRSPSVYGNGECARYVSHDGLWGYSDSAWSVRCGVCPLVKIK